MTVVFKFQTISSSSLKTLLFTRTEAETIDPAMKAYSATASQSSVKSSASNQNTTAMEERDSCYFPGCRKDANCNCDICLASINATLDLMPVTNQKSSLTKLSTSRANVECTPLSFDSSIISTPRSISRPEMDSPALKSTARLTLNQKKEKRKKEWSFGLGVLFFGWFWDQACFLEVLRPVFSSDMVRSIGERSWVVQDLNRRLGFLQSELKGFVENGKVSNCSFMDSLWEINQDGLLLYSRCILYKSAMEEVSIWGWPLQTAGLLKTEFSSRSFTVLSGRVTEWSDGRIGYSIRKANTSWVHRNWAASVVQLDPNTWILEYERSLISNSSTLFSAVAEIFKYRMSRAMKSMNPVFWLFSDFEQQYGVFTAKDRVKIIPT
ncbi:C-8 sterol isomerase [Salix suchowensis]|nr:C-8 sterol isomerase [Salix suchowensis]